MITLSELWSAIARPLRWLKAAGEYALMRRELDDLAKRVAALEAELARRPAPELCPLCHTPLRVIHTEPVRWHLTGEQMGEKRTLACASQGCAYQRQVKVDF